MDEMTKEALLTSLDLRVSELATQLGLTVAELLKLVETRIHERRTKAATDKVLAERWLESVTQ